MLLDRVEERTIIDDLVRATSKGSSGSLVLYGDAGMGKTELLDYASGRITRGAAGRLRVAGTLLPREAETMIRRALNIIEYIQQLPIGQGLGSRSLRPDTPYFSGS